MATQQHSYAAGYKDLDWNYLRRYVAPGPKPLDPWNICDCCGVHDVLLPYEEWSDPVQRGRPKGQPNRPKPVILAEKILKARDKRGKILSGLKNVTDEVKRLNLKKDEGRLAKELVDRFTKRSKAVENEMAKREAEKGSKLSDEEKEEVRRMGFEPDHEIEPTIGEILAAEAVSLNAAGQEAEHDSIIVAAR